MNSQPLDDEAILDAVFPVVDTGMREPCARCGVPLPVFVEAGPTGALLQAEPPLCLSCGVGIALEADHGA